MSAVEVVNLISDDEECPSQHAASHAQQAKHSRKRKRSPSPASRDVPSCPICLQEITDPRQHARTVPCLHTFCVSCLTEWAGRKRACALCRVNMEGYIHDIQSDTIYKEVTFPPLPSATTLGPSEVAGRLRHMLSQLLNTMQSLEGAVGQAAGASASSSLTIFSTGPPGLETAVERELRQLQSTLYSLGVEPPAAAQPARQRQRREQQGRTSRWEPQQAPAQGQASSDDDGDHSAPQTQFGSRQGGGRGHSWQPRPYYMRLRRGILSGVASRPSQQPPAMQHQPTHLLPPRQPSQQPQPQPQPQPARNLQEFAREVPAQLATDTLAQQPRLQRLAATSTLTSSQSAVNASWLQPGSRWGVPAAVPSASQRLLWRCSVYEQQLRAQPIQLSREERHLQSSQLDNQALVSSAQLAAWLERELTALLLDEDVGVLTAFVLGQLRSYGPTLNPAPDCLPVTHLRQFLHDRALPFWHELSVFAASGLSLAAYDNAVRYDRPALPAVPPAVSQPDVVASGGGAVGQTQRRSRRRGWDALPEQSIFTASVPATQPLSQPGTQPASPPAVQPLSQPGTQPIGLPDAQSQPQAPTASLPLVPAGPGLEAGSDAPPVASSVQQGTGMVEDALAQGAHSQQQGDAVAPCAERGGRWQQGLHTPAGEDSSPSGHAPLERPGRTQTERGGSRGGEGQHRSSRRHRHRSGHSSVSECKHGQRPEGLHEARQELPMQRHSDGGGRRGKQCAGRDSRWDGGGMYTDDSCRDMSRGSARGRDYCDHSRDSDVHGDLYHRRHPDRGATDRSHRDSREGAERARACADVAGGGLRGWSSGRHGRRHSSSGDQHYESDGSDDHWRGGEECGDDDDEWDEAGRCEGGSGQRLSRHGDVGSVERERRDRCREQGARTQGCSVQDGPGRGLRVWGWRAVRHDDIAAGRQEQETATYGCASGGAGHRWQEQGTDDEDRWQMVH